jgi:peptidoglycan hydrolase-like protein with peptidoglycan-binding domain
MSYINTLARYPISDGWQDHLNRGSRGGIDYSVGTGTPIPAPIDGRLENRPMTNGFGNYIRFHHGNGFVDEYLHLKDGGFVAQGNYKQGQIIGFSGSTGQSTGPHIHWHLIDPSGRRVNPLDYVQGSSGGGSGSPASSVTNSIRGVQQNLANIGLYDGAVDGITGPKTWRGIQTLLKTNGLYSGPIDGVPGKNTYIGLQKYGQKNGNYAPPGVIDGVLGPLSWAGFYQTLVEDIDAGKKAKDAADKAAAEAKKAADKAAADAKAVAEKVAKEQAARPVVPVTSEEPVTKPTEPTAKPVVEPVVKPNKETKPMAIITPLPEGAQNAASDAIGILIPKAQNRRIAYAIYGLAALVVSNIGVGIMAAGVQAPVWVIVASAVVGNLAVPFTTLAIANAKK